MERYTKRAHNRTAKPMDNNKNHNQGGEESQTPSHQGPGHLLDHKLRKSIRRSAANVIQHQQPWSAKNRQKNNTANTCNGK